MTPILVVPTVYHAGHAEEQDVQRVERGLGHHTSQWCMESWASSLERSLVTRIGNVVRLSERLGTEVVGNLDRLPSRFHPQEGISITCRVFQHLGDSDNLGSLLKLD